MGRRFEGRLTPHDARRASVKAWDADTAKDECTQQVKAEKAVQETASIEIDAAPTALVPPQVVQRLNGRLTETV